MDYQKNDYNVSDELKNELNSVSEFLDESRLFEFEKKINGAISVNDSDKLEKFNKVCEEFDKLLSEMHLYNISIFSRKYPGYNGSKIGIVFKSLKSDIIKNGMDNYFRVDKVEKKDYSDIFIRNVESLINSKYFDLKVANNARLKANFNQVKKVYVEVKEIEAFNESIDFCIDKLKSDNVVDFKDVIDFLGNLKKQNLNLLKEKEKYLKKFDLSSLEKDIKHKYEEESKESRKKSGMTSYQRLYYKLHKIQETDPNNYEEIRNLESKLRDCVREYGLDNSDIRIARDDALDKYYNDEMTKKVEKEMVKEQMDMNSKMKEDAYKRLRELAITELKLSGAFDSVGHVIKNGDISNAAEIETKEKMIADKMEEIAKISEMTPQERFISVMKSKNKISQEATVADLSEQTRMDANYAYRDSSYSFVKGYKNDVVGGYKVNLFSEYIKYKASLSDKSVGMNFSEFVKTTYSLENEQNISVTDSLEGRKR